MAHSSFDHLHAPRTHWLLVLLGTIVTLVCGTIGYLQVQAHDAAHASGRFGEVLGALYPAVQLLVLHPPHLNETNLWIEFARWLAVVTLMAGTWFLIWKRLRHELLALRCRLWRNHYVICGLGDRGLALARHVVNRAKVIVVDPHPDLDARLDCEALGILVIEDDATNPAALRAARICAAKEIVVLTESDETNVRVALAAVKLGASGDSLPKRCRVHLSDINLRDVLSRVAGLKSAKICMAVEYFDAFERSARRILGEVTKPAASETPNTRPRGERLVILGFGRMGRSLALAATNFPVPLNGQARHLLVVDRNGESQRERFLFRHPELGERIEFESAEVESGKTRALIEKFVRDREMRLHVFVCVDANTRATEISLRLWQVLANGRDCTLAVRIKTEESLGAILEVVESAESSDTSDLNDHRVRVVPFGMVEDWFLTDT